MFTIEYVEAVADDLGMLRAFERSRILDRIEQQLLHQPNRPSRHRKIIVGLTVPWEHEEPIWELRIGQFRVFYDVNESEQRVVIRAIRKKPPHTTTEEIL